MKDNTIIASYGVSLLCSVIAITAACAKKEEPKSEPTPAPASAPAPQHEETALDKIQKEGQTDEQQSAPTTDKSSPPPEENQADSGNGWNPAGKTGTGPNDKQWDAGYNTKEFQAVFLFQINGCRVYRFYDGGAWQFFQDCRYN